MPRLNSGVKKNCHQYLTIYVNEQLKSGQSVPIDKKSFAKYDRIPTDFME